MGKIVLKTETKIVTKEGKKGEVVCLDTEEFGKFNPELLGLGDISSRSTRVEAVAAAFDLSGFTNFCSQVDPQLSVPPYLSRFLNWLFATIKKEFVQGSYKGGKQLWAPLPFLAKFSGDGVLFLWDTKNMLGGEMCNIVVSLHNICVQYERKFYPQVKKVVAKAPKTLRCGIARGDVFSVGNGDDYVGTCINIASRLQKLSLLTFCVSGRGFDFENDMHKGVVGEGIMKAVPLRGIGEKELVWVEKYEFDRLPKKEKKIFRNP